MSLSEKLTSSLQTPLDSAIKQLVDIADSHTGERCQAVVFVDAGGSSSGERKALLARAYAALHKSLSARKVPLRAWVTDTTEFFETALPELAGMKTDLFSAVDNEEVQCDAAGAVLLVESSRLCSPGLGAIVGAALRGKACLILLGDANESRTVEILDGALRSALPAGQSAATAPITRRYVRRTLGES